MTTHQSLLQVPPYLLTRNLDGGTNTSRMLLQRESTPTSRPKSNPVSASMADFMGSKAYCCFKCQNLVAFHDDIVSKDFQASSGRAFLFSHAMNISLGPKEDRQLITGLHTVADVYCSDCGEELGWTYIKAYEESQKYKEGKYVLEKFKIVVRGSQTNLENYYDD
ncbi:hypothetical protein AHAS_Ahas08G0159400 [Arachis hypogaea]